MTERRLTCLQCGEPIVQKGIGRPRRFCGRPCAEGHAAGIDPTLVDRMNRRMAERI